MALSVLGEVQENEGRATARPRHTDRQDIKVTTLSTTVAIGGNNERRLDQYRFYVWPFIVLQGVHGRDSSPLRHP